MSRPAIYEQSLFTDGRLSVDPVDSGTIERLSKKGIREGEEKLLFAVLTNAIEDFQKYVDAKDETGRKLFQEAEDWVLFAGQRRSRAGRSYLADGSNSAKVEPIDFLWQSSGKVKILIIFLALTGASKLRITCK